MTLPDDWGELTPDQRLEYRLDAWQNVPIEFASPEVAQSYRDRVQLYRDVIALKKPATVPIAPWIGLLPFRYFGHTAKQAYYDYEIFKGDWYRFHEETRPDGLGLTLGIVPGKLFDVLDYHLYDWPGHGTPEDTCYQYSEQEWMKGDEYDALIQDPGSYWQRTYLPRVFGAMEPFSMLAPWTDLVEMPFTAPFFAGFSAPPVKEMLQKLMDAGDAAMEWLQAAMATDGRVMAGLGIPQTAGGATKAPYDILGDTMRGTRGLMLDKFRQPEKVKAAMERLVPQAIDWAVRSNNMTGNPIVFIPIHKGADGFMSDADFKELYWPTFKAVLLGLIGKAWSRGCSSRAPTTSASRSSPTRTSPPTAWSGCSTPPTWSAPRPSSASVSASAATCRPRCSRWARRRRWTPTSRTCSARPPGTAASS